MKNSDEAKVFILPSSSHLYVFIMRYAFRNNEAILSYSSNVRSWEPAAINLGHQGDVGAQIKATQALRR
jgi:hypothetical protein